VICRSTTKAFDRGFKFLTEWRERIEVRDRDEGRVQGCKFVTELREEC
jgi:hypothetical protein